MQNFNLFCFPFAGGSKYSYRGYMQYAPKNINIVPLELPGRGTRIKEDLIRDIEQLADDTFGQIRYQLQEPYAVYGHSMGTLLGYLVIKKIIRQGLNPPLHVFFSGAVGPSVPRFETPRYLMPKDRFIEKIKELGGLPEEILKDDLLLNFFEPILRADFQAIETYNHTETAPFDIPITVMIGTEEEATVEKARTWQKETTRNVEIKQFPGKHFFILDYEREIMQLILLKTSSLHHIVERYL